ncbi:MAG: exodeoxyribonuclease VII large subunit [Bacilli bacterium]
MENNYLTVSALNKYISYKFDTDNALKNVFIQGEISNFRISKGHLYFSLKDEESEIRAIMFGSSARTLNFIPIDGMSVLIKASVSVYVKGGTYNLSVYEMRQAGLGELYLNFLRLKEKLQKEGLFDQEHKLPIPSFIERIAVITSENGDAINDITSTIFKRFPLAKVYLYPALVQGQQAPKSLISALERANRDCLGQVIIIARGGGSAEDLSCFNDELLARAIFASKIPTVSGVGHEADYTICDFVSSLRAPTPTGAAVLLTKSQTEIAQNINEKRQLLVYYYKRILEQKYYLLHNLTLKYHFHNFIETLNQKESYLKQLTLQLANSSPLAKINNLLNNADNLTKRILAFNIQERLKQKIDYLGDKQIHITQLINRYVNDKMQAINQFYDKLNLLNPKNIMKKGYTLTYQEGKLITNVQELSLKNPLSIVYYDGEVVAQPVQKNNRKEE